jgi:RNA polymerase sigma factor (sigma-70 family)
MSISNWLQFSISNSLEKTSRKEKCKIKQIYFEEVGGTKNLDKDEELDLIIKAKNGCISSRNKVIQAHLKLVVSIANKYQQKFVDIFDLIEEGNLGLIYALDKFDVNKNCKFSTYSFYWIRSKIEQHLIEQSHDVRVPHHIFKKIKYFNNHQVEKEVTDDVKDSSVKMEISEKKKFKVIEKDIMVIKPNDIDTHLKVRPNFFYYNQDETNPEFKSSLQEESEALNHSLNKLEERNKNILIKRYGLFNSQIFTLKEISAELDLSTERVRQIQHESIKKLEGFIKQVMVKKK